ncbi:MAG: phosphoketolase family protein [Candidatus Nomurabacteria bacterium]|jgi:xylulose-5-phosphate/fructose-6-phosphate phosphoketolase|nr:phosphoketolase family protein [Candidatus Nomurabacteria bacterium]
MKSVGATESLEKYLRAMNYISAAQIFLQDNFLLEEPLKFEHIKPRLLGHWGSAYGINVAYEHLSKLIKETEQEMLFILGTGHGYAALQANLFAEGTLERYYTGATNDYDGLAYVCKNFSWPYAFPSHSNPKSPGTIYEGGELGYSLATAYGAVLDNPSLIAAVMVGDGEAETGPAAAAWQLNKIVDPRTNGVVLPILHLNGYKISAPTVYGRMSNREILEYFRGCGYEPRLVDGVTKNVHHEMAGAVAWAYRKIKDIKKLSPDEIPHLPMLILRTPKGGSGPKTFHGERIEGNALAHQVVLTEAKTDEEQLKLLEKWLKSYKFDKLFDRETGFGDYAKDILPDVEKTMGMNLRALSAQPFYKPLRLPPIEFYETHPTEMGEVTGDNSMSKIGLYLRDIFRFNTDNFRVFSPDESYSNKIDAIFEVTKRGWVWPIAQWDKDLAVNGRVMEILSEHSLEGMHEGYTLTGRHGAFVSYESFMQVTTSMIDQYSKWLYESSETNFRRPVPSLNFVLTSAAWRQDHNGFSHQNPGFIDNVLRHQHRNATVYFPADANEAIVMLNRMLDSTNEINVICAGKTPEPQWLSIQRAQVELSAGASIWRSYSDDNPQVVLSAAGDYMAKETIAAIKLIHRDIPQARLRFVHIAALSPAGIGIANNQLTQSAFNELYTLDKPIIFNFHGHPETLKGILYNYGVSESRASVHGYVEEGSITTPFDMHIRNRTSRYHQATEIIAKLHEQGALVEARAYELINRYQQKLQQNIAYVKDYGLDDPEVVEEKWTR